jgi:hypothetical protein
MRLAIGPAYRARETGNPAAGDRWFTNLHAAGNTGAASIFVMLKAAMPRLRSGDRVLLIVPESARFTLAFAQLSCVGPTPGPNQAELRPSVPEHYRPAVEPLAPVVPAMPGTGGCFLARLAPNRFADQFVLKGGALLAAFGESPAQAYHNVGTPSLAPGHNPMTGSARPR